MAYLNFSPAALSESAAQYREELLRVPVIAAKETLQHFTPVPGVRGKYTVGSLAGDIELAPYSSTRVDKDGVTLKGRTLEAYLGSVIKRFDPNLAGRSVYGSLVAQGEEITETQLAHDVLVYLSGKLGESLAKAIWTAERNGSGTTTNALFNGLGTIAKSTDFEHVALTSLDTNGFADKLIDVFTNADAALQMSANKLFIPTAWYNAYVRDYRDTWGASPYNSEYKKTFLEGTDNRVELVSQAYLTDKAILTTKENVLYGYGDGLAEENIAIEKHHPFVLDFVATMFFGTQFASADKGAVLVIDKPA